MSWTKLETFQDVAAALTLGDKIEVCSNNHDIFYTWEGEFWNSDFTYRSQAKKTYKTVVLREALMCFDNKEYFTRWTSENPPIVVGGEVFIYWITESGERIFNVEQ